MTLLTKATNRVLRPIRQMFHYDYASPSLVPLPDKIEAFFPNMAKHSSFNLRVFQTARIDYRFPVVGWVTWDEATILYNYGLALKGKRLLEIGSWVGWSTIAIALAGMRVTALDPVAGNTPQGEALRDSIQRAGLQDSIQPVEGFSPATMEALHKKGERWEAFFIDGNHEGDAPLKDAQACSTIAPNSSIVLFHDLINPNIADALSWLGRNGWHSAIHHTNTFVGVAWRGEYKPISHQPDPKVNWKKLIRSHWPHLEQFARV